MAKHNVFVELMFEQDALLHAAASGCFREATAALLLDTAWHAYCVTNKIDLEDL